MYKLGNESSFAETDLGVWVDGKLSASQQRALAAQSSSRALGCTKHSRTGWSWGENCPTLHCSGVAPCHALPAVFGTPI